MVAEAIAKIAERCRSPLANGVSSLGGIDEFEELDRRIGLKQFTEDVAATLRESLQSHRRIIWVFAGSHRFNDLPNVRWSSYLVSLRTLELPPFTPEETRLVLSQPLKHSRRKQAQAAVAAFGTGFWGEGGTAYRIHVEAGGWPHLVQPIASTDVDLCNTQNRPRADTVILDAALAKAVVSRDRPLRSPIRPSRATVSRSRRSRPP